MLATFTGFLSAGKKITQVGSYFRRRPGRIPGAGRNHRLALEILEDRAVPAVASWVPDEILVSFRPGTADVAKGQARAQAHGDTVETILTPAMVRSGSTPVERLKISGMAVDQAVAALSKNPNILFAEPNQIYNHSSVSNDPYYTSGNLWGMEGDTSIAGGPVNPYGSAANQAWNAGFTGSRAVYVGIIDEGYQYNHTDLYGNAGVNPGEIPSDGIDNDGNGYVDDVYGWDFFHNDNTVYDASENDHGTHVAGTIGATGGNGLGVVGVNWNVSLLSAKFLGPSGGTTANAIKAVDYFTNLKLAQRLNIVATNNSWGGGAYSQALQEAIIRAAKADILFVTAAGNFTNNNDVTPTYPANYSSLVGTPSESPATYDNVISVAAITSTGDLASFSNYGLGSVDLAAPGSSIYSSIPVNSYAILSGTSMAAPHVTGTAALYAAAYPYATAEQIRDAILLGTTATPSLAGKMTTGGRLNTWAALQVPPEAIRPRIAIGDYSMVEGNIGTTLWSFTVSLSFPAPAGGVLVQWATADGTATVANNDYVPAAGDLFFTEGESSRIITISVNGDTFYEPNETFTVNLTSPFGASILDGQGVGTIVNDDSAPPPLVSILDASIKEGQNRTRALRFPVNLSLPAAAPLEVAWSTANGTAASGLDYLAASGVLLIPVGTLSAFIDIQVIGDKAPEADEYFFVNLTAITPLAAIFDSQARGIILNDDRGQGFNEIPFDPASLSLAGIDTAWIAWLLESEAKPKH